MTYRLSYYNFHGKVEGKGWWTPADRRTAIYYVIQFPDPNVLAQTTRFRYHRRNREQFLAKLFSSSILSFFPLLFASRIITHFSSVFLGPCSRILLVPCDAKARKYGRQALENKHGRVVKSLNRGCGRGSPRDPQSHLDRWPRYDTGQAR